jgi:hypothetical protein
MGNRLQRGLEARYEVSVASELPGGFLAAPSKTQATPVSVQTALSENGVVYEVYDVIVVFGCLALVLFTFLICRYGSSSSGLSEVERRVAAVEAALGRSTSGLPLRDEIERVRRSVELLSETELQKNAEKMKQLLDLGKKVDGGEAGSYLVVQDVLDKLRRWDETVAALPGVVARLTQLRELHERAARSAESVAEIENEQKAIRMLLENGRQLLETVQRTVATNQTQTDKNVAALLQRLETLKN